MAACTICTLDPCPHLVLKGGTAGAPIFVTGPAKYAPSLKPHCIYCDRGHRNIGIDAQPVCAWRTYSRAKGENFVPFTPDNVAEFASWFKAGGWAAPTRKARGTTKPAPSAASVASATASPTTRAPGTIIITTMSATPDEIEPIASPTIPTIDDIEEAPAVSRLVGTADGTPDEQEADILFFEATSDPALQGPRKAPSFASSTDINNEAAVTI